MHASSLAEKIASSALRFMLFLRTYQESFDSQCRNPFWKEEFFIKASAARDLLHVGTDRALTHC